MVDNDGSVAALRDAPTRVRCPACVSCVHCNGDGMVSQERAHFIRKLVAEKATNAAHYFFDADIHQKLDKILAALSIIKQENTIMSVELDNLAAQVAANIDLEKSTIQLITGLAAQIKAAAEDPAKVNALADALHTSAKALSDALVAGTPAAPAPVPAPPPAA